MAGAAAHVMTFVDDTEVTGLRERIRHLIHTELPADFAGAIVPGNSGQTVANEFCRRLARENLLTPAWPREYGGSDADIWAHGEPCGAQYIRRSPMRKVRQFFEAGPR